MCWERLLCERRRSIVPRPDQDPDDTRARAKLARLALWARSNRLPRPDETAGNGDDEPSKAAALERRCPAHLVVEPQARRRDRCRRNCAPDRPSTTAATVRASAPAPATPPNIPSGYGRSQSLRPTSMDRRSCDRREHPEQRPRQAATEIDRRAPFLRASLQEVSSGSAPT